MVNMAKPSNFNSGILSLAKFPLRKKIETQLQQDEL